jgi:hypothetical protein
MPPGIKPGQMSGEEKLAEIDWLLSCGSGWYEICRQLGCKPNTLSKLAWRHGRRDLTAYFDHIRPSRSRERTAA